MQNNSVTALTSLDLSRNQIGSEGATSLGDALKVCFCVLCVAVFDFICDCFVSGYPRLVCVLVVFLIVTPHLLCSFAL